MFNKSQEATSKVVIPKWKYVVTILMLLIAGAILGIYSSIERQLEKSFHQMWLEEEIPYPVESEYTMLTATSMVGYGLYAIGLDQSSLLYQPLHYLNRIAYESATKKIPEDDSIREWFYFYRHYYVPLATKDIWMEENILDLIDTTKKLIRNNSKSSHFVKETRYLYINGILSYFANNTNAINKNHVFGEIDDLFWESIESFVEENSNGSRETFSNRWDISSRLLPFEISFNFFHYTLNRSEPYFETCNQDAYKHFIRVYKNNINILNQCNIRNLLVEEQERVNKVLASNKKLRNALAESAWVVCHINLDAMEEAYDKNRRRYQY